MLNHGWWWWLRCCWAICWCATDANDSPSIACVGSTFASSTGETGETTNYCGCLPHFCLYVIHYWSWLSCLACFLWINQIIHRYLLNRITCDWICLRHCWFNIISSCSKASFFFPPFLPRKKALFVDLVKYLSQGH
jgi:hypothetical protein